LSSDCTTKERGVAKSKEAQEDQGAGAERLRAKHKVFVYSDGGASPNPGAGGWAVVLKCPAHKLEKEIFGYEAHTTNNRMELTAIIRGLEALKTACCVRVITDSQYVAHAFTKGWLEKWKRKNWKTGGKKPVKNQDLWKRLDALLARHEVQWEWVRGHAGHEENERCDELVHVARERKQAYCEQTV